jgi:predicted SprT family Zn-dependent metalloprotease
MALLLNAEMLAHAYDYLCCQPPFNKWNLPPSEDVRFSVIKKRDRYAHYQMKCGVHHIVFSSRYVGRHEVLIATMAHELIHLHMESLCMDTRNPHGAAFHKFADRICKIHEFDRLVF